MTMKKMKIGKMKTTAKKKKNKIKMREKKRWKLVLRRIKNLRLRKLLLSWALKNNLKKMKF